MHKLSLSILLTFLLFGCSDQESSILNLIKGKISGHRGNMNISCFVYRDINRNGIYDLQDRPYSGLRFTLERPDRDPTFGESNIAGFANFEMSLNNPGKQVSTAGTYKVIAKPRGDWRVTSGNLEQLLEIKELQASPAGLVATKTLQPLGVAPVLSISGRIELNQSADSSEYRLTAISPEGVSTDVNLSAEGTFTLPATQGEWQLELLGSEGAPQRRRIVVKNYPVIMSQFSSEKHYASEDQNWKNIQFDDLTTSDTLYEIPNGYGGLNWHNWISTHHKFYQGSGYINATVSGEFLAYNSSGHPADISSNDTFDIHGVYIGVAWPKAELGDILIQAWRNEEIVYQDSFRGMTTGPVWFAADYKDITRVEFSTEKYWQLMLDDLQYSN